MADATHHNTHRYLAVFNYCGPVYPTLYQQRMVVETEAPVCTLEQIEQLERDHENKHMASGRAQLVNLVLLAVVAGSADPWMPDDE